MVSVVFVFQSLLSRSLRFVLYKNFKFFVQYYVCDVLSDKFFMQFFLVGGRFGRVFGYIYFDYFVFCSFFGFNVLVVERGKVSFIIIKISL